MSTTKTSSTGKKLAESKKMAEAVSDSEMLAAVVIEPLKQETLYIPIVGISPLIQHAWDPKTKKIMLDKMRGLATIKSGRPPKDPEAEFHAAKYLLESGLPGHPATAFKIATVDACSLFSKDVTKVAMKRALFFHGQGPDMLVPIQFEECVMREDTVRVGMGTVDLRYRPMYTEWSCTVKVDFMPHLINRDSVLALVQAGGTGGIGEWRPSAPKSSGGIYGRYDIDLSRELVHETNN